MGQRTRGTAMCSEWMSRRSLRFAVRIHQGLCQMMVYLLYRYVLISCLNHSVEEVLSLSLFPFIEEETKGRNS